MTMTCIVNEYYIISTILSSYSWLLLFFVVLSYGMYPCIFPFLQQIVCNGNRCFTVYEFTSNIAFEAALAFCRDKGDNFNLATIFSEEENEIIHGFGDGVIFNLRRSVSTGDFGEYSPSPGTWETQTYFNWDPNGNQGAPGGTEDCAVIWLNSAGKWHDLVCTMELVNRAACLEIKPKENGNGGGGKWK